MDIKDAEFQQHLKEMFRVEAEEHLRAITAGLIELEQLPPPARVAEIIELVFRETHSLKGAARSVGLKDISSLCQPLEEVFAALQRQQLSVTPTLYDRLHQGVDAIAALMASTEMGCAPTDRARVRALVRQLGQLATQAAPADAPAPSTMDVPTPAPVATLPRFAPLPALPSPLPEDVLPPLPVKGEEKSLLASTVRIPTARLDELLLQAEELSLVKMTLLQRTADLREIQRALGVCKGGSASAADRHAPASLPRTAERQLQETEMAALESQVAQLLQALEADERAVKRLVDEHLDAMKNVLMLPVTTLVETFPKVVRDLAHEQGKDVELVMQGLEIEIDKRILEELKDPLLHLLRNCVDHGIRKPAEREQHQKPPRGTISITCTTTENRQVDIVIADDGMGIDLASVRAAALKMGSVSREAAEMLDTPATIALIFQSGVSTSAMITDISGRGLGMAIVREKVEKLGGVITVDTEPQLGTTFRLRVPLTLATFRGVLARVQEQFFVLPTLNVLRVLRVPREAIQTVENRDTVSVDGRVLALVKLGDALGLPSHTSKPAASANANAANYRYVMVLASADRRLCVEVDEVLDEQQVLLKGLGKQLPHVRNLAGATVLSTGKVVPVLHVPDVMHSAMQAIVSAAAPKDVSTQPPRGRLLVAEDSITARALLKNILETAGYQVTTAVDGMDAFMQVRGGEFDLVISDVDMPRMSGFELTTRMRADKKLAEVPVVLVTALESREDRERGIDAGANAYIVKSSFDQSNLLAVVRQLL